MSTRRLRSRLIPVIAIMFLCDVYCYTCPQNCVCSSNKYTCNSTTDMNEFSISQSIFRMEFGCKNLTLNVNCFDLPHVNRQYPQIAIGDCHPSVLTCLSNTFGINQPWIQHIVWSGMNTDLRQEHIEDLKFLKSITFYPDGNKLLSAAIINPMKNIEIVQFSEAKLELSSDKLNSTSLQELYFLNGNVDNLQSEVFQGLPNLKILNLVNVPIEHINVGFLSGLRSLQSLELIDNNLTSIEVGVFTSTPELRQLIITLNPLVLIPAQLLINLNTLEVLVIERPEEEYLNSTDLTVDIDAFVRLRALQNITIRHCNLHKRHVNAGNSTDATINSGSTTGNRSKYISPMIFTNLKSVIVSGHCIAEISNVMFSNATTLKELNLSDNMIEKLPNNIFSGLSDLVYLDLSNNLIKVLQDGLFSNLTALQTLKSSNNAIVMLTIDVFIDLKHLTELHLENNNIMSIASSFGADASPFRHLSQLKILDMSYNRISSILGLAAEMPSIQYLNVSNNDIDSTRDFENFFFKKNMTIDLSKNKISQARLKLFIDQPFNGFRQSNCIVNIEHNPFVCDCYNYGLYVRSKGSGEQNDPNFILGDSTCSDPPHLKGKIIVQLSPTDLVCVLKAERCPRNCTCKVIPATRTAVIDCNKMPDKIGSGTEHFAVTLNLKTHPARLADNIRTLNLSNTALHDITFNLTDNLKVLDVSRNNLTTLPDEILKSNITLYVADNPLECDCSLVQGLRKDRVADYELVQCSDGTQLSTIDVTRLCMWKTLLMGYICMGVIVSIFLFKCGLSTYRDMKRKRKNFTAFLFRYGSDYSINLERSHDITKEYDLFISFAHEDTEFVRDNLLRKLEKDLDLKVCFHHRDWLPGELIEDQIVRSVESSRRTIIILTEAFILSEWSYLEFKTAHNMSVREGKPRVIIILLEESIVDDERLSRAIKSYTSVNTYLVWGDPNFWQKLKRILPKRRR